jgi:hypothetical protein
MSRTTPRLRLSPYRSIFALALAATVTACIALATSARAHLHHSPDGTTVNWYPGDCCHDGDCHPVLRIRPVSDGFLMTTEDGITLFVSASRWRRPSQDDRWHVCFGAGDNPAAHCVFEPPNS